MQTTDIVMDTLNRLPLLQRSIESILEGTKSPYRLYVIDDASTEGNAEYLLGLWKEGKIAEPILRKKRRGIPANWNMVPELGKSEIVVYTNGDVICPNIKPDWIRRGLKVLGKYPDLGMVSLNSPMSNAKRDLRVLKRRPGVTISDRVPSFFLFVRRELMLKIKIPDIGGKLAGVPIVGNYYGIDHAWSRAMRLLGYQVGYLEKIYCKHIGLQSVRTNADLTKWSIECDPITLTPPKRFRG